MAEHPRSTATAQPVVAVVAREMQRARPAIPVAQAEVVAVPTLATGLTHHTPEDSRVQATLQAQVRHKATAAALALAVVANPLVVAAAVPGVLAASGQSLGHLSPSAVLVALGGPAASPERRPCMAAAAVAAGSNLASVVVALAVLVAAAMAAEQRLLSRALTALVAAAVGAPTAAVQGVLAATVLSSFSCRVKHEPAPASRRDHRQRLRPPA